MMRSKLWLAAAVAVCVLASVATAAELACSAEEGPVSCATCKTASSGNFMEKLPRVNFGGKSVSSNLGTYDIVDCSSGSCSTHINAADLTKSDNAPSNIFSYVQSIALYAAFAILCALVAFLCSFCSCICKCCCCGRCDPTPKDPNSRCCGCCGFVENYNPTAKVKYEYPRSERVATRLYMTVFVAFIAAFIAVGSLNGVNTVHTSLKAIANGPAPLVQTFGKMITPITNLVVDVSGNVLVPGIQQINATVAAAMDINVLVGSVRCVLDKASHIPSLTPVTDFIDSVQATITRATKVADGVDSTVANVQQTVTGVNTGITNVRTLITKMTWVKGNLTNVRPTLNTQLQTLATAQTQLLDNTHGIPGIKTRLTTLGTSTSYPTEAEATTAANGAAGGTLEELLDNASPMVGVQTNADRDVLIQRLTDINNKFLALPSPSAIITDIQAIDTVRQNLVSSNIVAQLKTSITKLQNIITLIPTATSVNNAATSLQTGMNTLNVTLVKGVASDVDYLLAHLPKFAAFGTLIDNLFSISSIVPCAADLLDQVKGLDKTIIQLPSMFDSMTDALDQVNGTLIDARKKVDDVKSALKSADDATHIVVNTTQLVNMVTSFQDTVTPVNNAVNSFKTQTNSVSFTGVDLADLQNKLTVMQTQLTSMSTPTSLISTLQSVQYAINNATTYVDGSITSIQNFAKGRCASGTSLGTICTSNTDCAGGATCTFAMKKCANNYAASCTGLQDNTDCGSGSGHYCLFEYSKYFAAQQFLSNWKVPTLGESAYVTSMNNLQSSLNVDLTAPQTSLNTMNTQVQSLDLTTPSNQLNSADSSLSSASGKVNSLQGTFSSFRTTLNSIPNISGVKDQLKSFNSTLSKVNDQLKLVRDFEATLLSVQKFLIVTLPNLMKMINKSSLVAARSAGGIEAVTRQFIDFASNVTHWLETDFTFQGKPMKLGLDIKKMVNDANVYKYLHILSQNSYFNNGPAYFIGSLYSALTPSFNTIPSTSAQATTGRIFTDSTGQKYAGSAMCLTQACVNNAIDFYYTSPISEVTAEFGSPLSVPLSVLQIFSLPFLVPGIAALCGLCGAWCFCFGKSWQRFPTCCSMCCMFPCMPIAFFFAGIGFVFVMAGADACRGAPNIAYDVATGSASTFCKSFGTWTGTSCQIKLGDASANLDMGTVMNSLLGTCTAGQPGPLQPVLSAVNTAYASYPQKQLNSSLDSFSSTIAIRPMMRKTLVDISGNVGGVVTNFLNNIGGVFTCAELNGDIAGFTQPLCCNVIDTFYWITSAWYLMAFAMCFCGCPAACLGRKRFVNVPWGKRYEELVAGQTAPQQALELTNRSGPTRTRGGSAVETRGPNTPTKAAPLQPAPLRGKRAGPGAV